VIIGGERCVERKEMGGAAASVAAMMRVCVLLLL
jgi:hypothetical protein